MTKTKSKRPVSPSVEGQNANEIAAQSAALAAHLLSSGVQFLPKANDEVAQNLSSELSDPSSDSDASSDVVESNAQPLPVKIQRSSTNRLDRGDNSSASKASDTLLIDAEQSQQPYPGESLGADERSKQLSVLAEQVSGCTRCDKLVACRTQTVFGEGSCTPRVVFFGEGPGANEDKTGRPFVGEAGQLLTKIIEACTFRREDVYILNTVKCRPPGNRNPEPDEIDNCREFFEAQLRILRPEYIVCLGAVGSQTLLRSKLSVGMLRGKLHSYYDSKVLVTYHPAYLLRNTSAKKAVWQDLKIMLRDAGIEV